MLDMYTDFVADLAIAIAATGMVVVAVITFLYVITALVCNIAKKLPRREKDESA